MRKLNDLSAQLLKQTFKPTTQNLKSQPCEGKGIFVPELIEIICPIFIPEDSTRPSTIDTTSTKSEQK
jgi:hypothetical protein